MNDPEEAIANLDKALEIDPEYYDALSNRAYALLLLAKNLDSLSAYEALIKRNPEDAGNFASKAIVLYNLQRFGDAIVAIREALVIDPNNAQVRDIWPVISTFAGDDEPSKAVRRMLGESS